MHRAAHRRGRRATPAVRRPRASGPGRPRRGAVRRAVDAVVRRSAAGAADRGASPVELAVVMPLILVLLFASVQVAVWFVARSTALNAAQSAVNAQRVHQAPADAGTERATRFLRASGDWLVGWDRPAPTCQTTATEVTCTVRGRSLSVIPLVSFPVRQTAHGTVERWTTS
ncbi:TadE family protein [Micromonospora musae]|uniref:Pilus assembly protein n=1 Tax=Micromonospora musae TaxID=1894970 RepID=A0A3A9YAB5_9ACTN|nr:pilus assembly protein [Micromonospora musae]